MRLSAGDHDDAEPLRKRNATAQPKPAPLADRHSGGVR